LKENLEILEEGPRLRFFTNQLLYLLSYASLVREETGGRRPFEGDRF
jgi:hypothetical protein